MSNRKDLPSTSAPNFNQRLRETIQTYLGKQGDPLDRGLTLRDLIANGIVKFKDGFNANSLAGGGGGTLPIAPVAVDNGPDLTPPPQPSGFAVTGAISHVFIEHEDPIYPQGRGHLRTRVYGVIVEAGDPLPTFNDAVEVGQFSGVVWAMPSNPSTTWRIWIKWETNDGVLSPTPAGGTNGLEAVTGQNVALLLAALNGKVTESQLFADLGARIDLVDGAGPGSVNQRVAAEAVARAGEIQELANTSAQNLLNEAEARATGDGALQTQINTLSAASSGEFQDLIAALQEEQTARIDGDSTESTARQTLATQVRGAYTGTDITDVTTGLMFSERQARASADEALSQDITSLSSAVEANQTSTESAINTEAVTRADADSANATQIDTLNTGLETLSGTVATKADAVAVDSLTTRVTTAEDSITAQGESITGLQSSLTTTNNAVATKADASALTTTNTNVTNLDDTVTAQAEQITTLTSSVGENSSAIQTEASTRATQTGDLFAQYTVKIDANGYVSGFGLASTANDATPFSEFAVRADNFYIASPEGPGVAPSMPFIVQTTATTINEVEVPVGVYMNDAFIQNGTITNAKIANLAVDNAKIANLSADKLTAGSIAVGQHIQSTEYDPGVANSTGFRIDGDGSFFAGQNGGNRISWDGTNLNVVSPGLTLNDGSATFSGNLNAAGGTFNGTIDVKSAASGARMEIANNVIKVFDSNGTLRVQIGSLAA